MPRRKGAYVMANVIIAIRDARFEQAKRSAFSQGVSERIHLVNHGIQFFWNKVNPAGLLVLIPRLLPAPY